MFLTPSNDDYIRLEKHLQCEKLLGLARGTTKKRGNKKSDERLHSAITIAWAVVPPLACIRNINSSHDYICPQISKWIYKYIGIGHHPTSKNWPGKHGKLPVHVNDVVTDWLSSDFLFPRFLVVPPANPSNFSHCKCFSSRIDLQFKSFIYVYILHFPVQPNFKSVKIKRNPKSIWNLKSWLRL